MDEYVFRDSAEADPFLRQFFGDPSLTVFFESLFRNVRSRLPSAVIRGKENEIVGISPKDQKYLFYILPQNGQFAVRFRTGEKVILQGSNFNRIYQLSMAQLQHYNDHPETFEIKSGTAPREVKSVPVSEPKTDVAVSGTGKVIDRGTGEILSFEESVNTLLYFMKELADRKARFDAENQPLIEMINSLKEGIKDRVLEQGEGLVCGRMAVSVSQPRITWDSEGLESYAANHPEILEYQSAGNPIVSFRLLKEDGKTE